MAAPLDLAAVSSAVDLSRLPAPQVVIGLDYEGILAERLADLKARIEGSGGSFDAILESDPAVKLEETDAYRELLAYAAINDAARSVMLAFARGSDLDHLAAFYNVQRLTIVPATDTAPAVLEPDADFRRRVQLAPEELARTGLTGGAYRSLALRTAPSVKDVATIRRGGGRIDVVLLGRDGDGSVAVDVVNAVAAAFEDDAATQLTDIVSVRAAEILPYSVSCTLRVPYGPDRELIAQASTAAIRAYALRRHRVGETVFVQMIEAAASVGGVEQATAQVSIGGADLARADVDPGTSGAAYLTDVVVSFEAAQ
ncbi:MAG: baseplate J/gp47 family protein [Bacillota bacterium]